MKRVLQGFALLLVLLVLAAGGGFGYATLQTEARLSRTWPDVKGKEVPVPWPLSEAEVAVLHKTAMEASTAEDALNGAVPSKDAAVPDPMAGIDLTAIAMERAIERGKYLATIRLGCTECHGKDLGGSLVADAQPVWSWYAPNISSGGVMKNLPVTDWDRAIRHGILPDGRSSTMPAVDYMSLSDQELSDLISYAKSLPPSDKVQPPTIVGPVGKMLFGFGVIPISAEEIDHTKVQRELPPEAAVTVEYGAHLAAACVGCHRTTYDGGKIAQGPPDWPPARNLTPAGELGGWTEEDFLKTLRTGVRPNGEKLLSPMAETTTTIGQMSDTELKAMFAFFKSLPPRPDGT
jgi:mono/diheme cytochrome c family protein